DLLRSGNSVVLDFQANTKNGRSWFRSVFEQAGTAHELHFLDASDEICLSRIAMRNIKLPEGSHHLTEEIFMHITSYFQPPEATEGFNVIAQSQHQLGEA
ncbi:MAG: AAA family ATPase, partial [Betaproteobacteria bacterium]